MSALSPSLVKWPSLINLVNNSCSVMVGGSLSLSLSLSLSCIVWHIVMVNGICSPPSSHLFPIVVRWLLNVPAAC